MNMLSGSLREIIGPLNQLLENLSGKNGLEWLEAIKKFLRKEPTWAEGMIYQPLRWSGDFGNVPKGRIQACVDSCNTGNSLGWRLPTEKELIRALRIKDAPGFVVGVYYWTSTVRDDGGIAVCYTHDGRGGCGEAPDSRIDHIHLRLVRTIELGIMNQP
jgi:hypothetical protein